MAFAGQRLEVCYADQGTALVTIGNLGNSCGATMVECIGALLYSVMAIIQMFLTHGHLTNKGTKLDDELDSRI